jgi:hypothetical protein
MILGPREYAKHRRVTIEAVMKAIRTQRLAASVKKGENGRWEIDRDHADAEWVTNSAESHNPRTTGSRALDANVLARLSATDGLRPMTYQEARTQRERFMSELARLEFEERQGTLVKAEQVRTEAFRIARIVRDSLLNLPDRVAGEFSAESNQFKIHTRLTQEIRRAIEELKFE